MNILIRDALPDDADAVAQVMVTSMQTAFRGLVPEHCLQWPDSARDWRRTLTNGFETGGFLHVAQTETGQVVGYAMAGLSTDVPGFPGEVKQISVLPSHQGQGIGRLLVCDVARQLADAGIHGLCVRVLENNPYRLFYERLGGQYLSQRLYDWDGVLIPEYTYGWQDTQPLLE